MRRRDHDTLKKIALIRVLTTWYGVHLKTAIYKVIPAADEKAVKNWMRKCQQFKKKRPKQVGVATDQEVNELLVGLKTKRRKKYVS